FADLQAAGHAGARAAQIPPLVRGQDRGPDVLADRKVVLIIGAGAGGQDGVVLPRQEHLVPGTALDGRVDLPVVTAGDADGAAAVVLAAALLNPTGYLSGN